MLETEIPLRTFVLRAAMELEKLYGRMDRLEYGLDILLTQADNKSFSGNINVLQDLDLLRQTLSALSDFLTETASKTNTSGLTNATEAIASIPLRDVADRMAGISKAAPVQRNTELF